MKTKRRTHARGSVSKTVQARRAYLVYAGKASWIPIYKGGVDYAIKAAGL